MHARVAFGWQAGARYVCAPVVEALEMTPWLFLGGAALAANGAHAIMLRTIKAVQLLENLKFENLGCYVQVS